MRVWRAKTAVSEVEDPFTEFTLDEAKKLGIPVIGILDTGFKRTHEAFNFPGHTLQVIADAMAKAAADLAAADLAAAASASASDSAVADPAADADPGEKTEQDQREEALLLGLVEGRPTAIGSCSGRGRGRCPSGLSPRGVGRCLGACPWSRGDLCTAPRCRVMWRQEPSSMRSNTGSQTLSSKGFQPLKPVFSAKSGKSSTTNLDVAAAIWRVISILTSG